MRHKKAENLSATECGRKFDVLPKLIQQWEKQYEAGKLAQAAGRRAVSPEQAEITRLRAELSRAKMEVSILMALGHPEKAAVSRGTSVGRTSRKRASEVRLYPCRTLDVPIVGRLPGAWRDPIGLPRLAGQGALAT